MVFSGPKGELDAVKDGVMQLASMRLCGNALTQLVIPAALVDSESTHEMLVPGGRLFEQRKATLEALDKIDGVDYVTNHAAFYLFPRLDKSKFDFEDAHDFAMKFLHEQHVLVIPGDGFDWHEDLRFRIVMLPEPETLTKAMGDMAYFLNSIESDFTHRCAYRKGTVRKKLAVPFNVAFIRRQQVAVIRGLSSSVRMLARYIISAMAPESAFGMRCTILMRVAVFGHDRGVIHREILAVAAAAEAAIEVLAPLAADGAAVIGNHVRPDFYTRRWLAKIEHIRAEAAGGAHVDFRPRMSPFCPARGLILVEQRRIPDAQSGSSR